MIRASCHTDDYAIEVDFDAEPYFHEVDDWELLQLARVEWGGDYPADAVALYLEPTHAGIAEMFTYLRSDIVRQQRNAPGFECHIDPEDAMAWLEEYRPHLLERIEKGDFGPPVPPPSVKEWKPQRKKK